MDWSCRQAPVPGPLTMTSCPAVSSRRSVLANRAVAVDADPRRAPSMGWPRSRTCATNRSGRDSRNRYSTTPYSTKGSPTLTQARSGSSSSSTAGSSATRLVRGPAVRATAFRPVDVGPAGESTAEEAVDHMYAPVSSCSPVHVYSSRPSGSRRGGRTSSNEKHRGQVTINGRHFPDPRDESSEPCPQIPGLAAGRRQGGRPRPCEPPQDDVWAAPMRWRSTTHSPTPACRCAA